jgi:hypothetical protein
LRKGVEQIFGAPANDMGGALLLIIGLVRTKAKIEMNNFACNMRRLGQLRRRKICPA